jgi:hypothetical protein
LDDNLQDMHLFTVEMVDDYFAEIIHLLSTRLAPSNFTVSKKKQLVVKAMDYQLIVGNLCKLGANVIL